MRRADRADAFLMGSVSAILIAFSIQARKRLRSLR